MSAEGARLDVSPYPNCPLLLMPQHLIPPVLSSAQQCQAPHWMSSVVIPWPQSVMGSSRTSRVYSVLVPPDHIVPFASRTKTPFSWDADDRATVSPKVMNGRLSPRVLLDPPRHVVSWYPQRLPPGPHFPITLREPSSNTTDVMCQPTCRCVAFRPEDPRKSTSVLWK